VKKVKEPVMPAESSAPNDKPIPVGCPPTSPFQKAAATRRRHVEERRAESLSQIQAQIADGTLVIRHMTVAQHKAASEVVRQTLARKEARGVRPRGLGSHGA
jgi:hypothetical protein